MAVAEKQFQNYVGGKWTDAASGDTFESLVPATGEALGSFPRSAAAHFLQRTEVKAVFNDFLGYTFKAHAQIFEGGTRHVPCCNAEHIYYSYSLFVNVG